MLFLLILGLFLNQGNTNKYNYTPVILLKESENMSTKKKSICPIIIVLKCYFRCRMSEHNDLQLIYLNHDRYHYCYEGSVGIWSLTEISWYTNKCTKQSKLSFLVWSQERLYHIWSCPTQFTLLNTCLILWPFKQRDKLNN